jgi:glycosyltransferase involved in cell wall biosynthesis
MKESVLLLTDSYKVGVNGISVFTHFFIEDVLAKHFKSVMVYEASTKKLFKVNEDAAGAGLITDIYVNANFSVADFFIRSNNFEEWCASKNIRLSPIYKKIMVSHGWTKTKVRSNYYSIYYNLKYFFRASDLERLHFYDELLFISKAKDSFRHADYLYCLEQNIPVSYYDFSAAFIDNLKWNKAAPGTLNRRENINEYIIVIANFEKVKNLWWLLRYNLGRVLKRRKMKNFLVLVPARQSISFKLFRFLSPVFSTKIVHDQDRKFSLLSESAYMFIPSFTEYHPIVALEAAACNKPVVSLYRIPALQERRLYHHLVN